MNSLHRLKILVRSIFFRVAGWLPHDDWIVIGWAFLTAGLIVGAAWAALAQGYAAADPRVKAMSVQDPKIFFALLCWAVYSFELFAARWIGWGGRRAAYLSALGFAIVLLNFVPISYFLTKSHNF